MANPLAITALVLLVLGWAAGGLVTAVVLRAEQVLHGWTDVLWMTLAWAIGGAVFVLGTILGTITGGSTLSTSVPVGAAALGGAVGGAGMIYVIRGPDRMARIASWTATKLHLRGGPIQVPALAAIAQPNLRPRWISALWFALAFGSGVIFWQFHWANPRIEDAASGAFFGLVAAYGLYLEHVLRERLSLLWLALGSALASAAVGVIFQAGGTYIWLAAAVGGAIWGVALALVLRNEQVLPDRMSLRWTTAAWLVARIIMQAIFEGPIASLAQRGINVMTLSDLNFALYGALGGLATIWLIRNAGEKRPRI